jgi:hypothetical protein
MIAGRAIAGFPTRRPGFNPGSGQVGFVVAKWRRGRLSPSTSVSPAIHSTNFSILTITRGRYNRPVSGRRAKWTQFGLHYARYDPKWDKAASSLQTPLRFHVAS